MGTSEYRWKRINFITAILQKSVPMPNKLSDLKEHWRDAFDR